MSDKLKARVIEFGTGEDLDGLVRSGVLAPVAKQDIKPDALRHSTVSKALREGAPIYVMPMRDSVSGDAAVRATTVDGKPFIVINESSHKWTPDYVRKYLQPADSELDTPARRMHSEFLKGEAITFDEQSRRDTARADRYKRIEAFIEAQKAQYGITDLRVFVEPSGHVHDASVLHSQEGNKYLRLNQQDLRKALSSDAATESYLGLVGHEFSHLKHGDNTPESFIARRGNMAADKAIELRSDIEGAGPMGSGKPEASAAHFRGSLADAMVEYNKKNPPITNPTPADLRRVAQWDSQKRDDTEHPDHFERLSVLEIEASLMHGKKQMAARTGNADAPAELSGWMVEKLLKQYKHGELPEPASLRSAPAPAAELPEGVKKQVGEMGKLPMEAGVEAPKTSAPTPAAVKDEQPVQVK